MSVRGQAWWGFAALLTVTPAVAGGDPAAGREKAQACVACHGEDGRSTQPIYPNLAGQYESYLVHALTAYRDGGRENAIMNGLAAGLSDQDIADLAAWYAAQEGLEDLSIK